MPCCQKLVISVLSSRNACPTGSGSGDRVVVLRSVKGARHPTASPLLRDELHPGRQGQQLLEIAPVERQVRHLFGGDQAGNGRGRRIHLRHLARHCDHFRGLSYGKLEINQQVRADGQRDSRVNHLLEAGLGGLNLVVAYEQLWNEPTALGIGHRGISVAGTDIRYLDARSHYHRSRGICHGAGNNALIGLRHQMRNKDANAEQSRQRPTDNFQPTQRELKHNASCFGLW